MAKQDNSTDKGKATITGSFFRINKDINEDFTHQCKKSEKFQKTDSQSQRDVIMQELMKHYMEKGDNLFNILETTPF